MASEIRVAHCAIVGVICLLMLGGTAYAADPEFAGPTVVTDFFDFGGDRRAFGVAVADFDEDDHLDVVASFVNGNVAFVRGNGDGTFEPKVVFPWKQTFFNGWAFTAADVNGDDHADVVWGAIVTSGPVSDGDVRAFLGNGDGTFQLDEYLVSGVSHNAGLLLAHVGVDVGSLAAGDLNGDLLDDVIVGAEDTGDTVVTAIYNLGGGVFTMQDVFRRSKDISLQAPIWFAPPGKFGTTRDTIWGIALADADGDNDLDLWLGDRALYVYRYLNDGVGNFALEPPAIPPVPTRPEVYLPHQGFLVVGYSPSMAAGDLNHDGVPDFVLGLQQGAHPPGSVAHDGELLIDLSTGDGHVNFGGSPLADVGSKARGVNVADVNGDSFMDILTGTYAGEVLLFLQIPPDTDDDGVTDDVDNCVFDVNPGQEDVDGDGAGDVCDTCPLIANPEQSGDACACPDDPAPYSQGFWHHECMVLPADQGGFDPGKNGKKPQSFHDQTEWFGDTLVPCADLVLGNLLDFLEPELQTCDGLDADPANDQCQKAEKQLTALLLNVCSGQVSEQCTIDLEDVGCESDNVSDLFFEMAEFIESGDCKQAKKCAAALNEGEGFVELPPPGSSVWQRRSLDRRPRERGSRRSIDLEAR